MNDLFSNSLFTPEFFSLEEPAFEEDDEEGYASDDFDNEEDISHNELDALDSEPGTSKQGPISYRLRRRKRKKLEEENDEAL